MTKITQPYAFKYEGLVPEDKGITGFVVIAESHISVHTYPEIGLLMVDILTCGKTHPREGLSVFERKLSHERVEIRELRRGGDRIG